MATAVKCPECGRRYQLTTGLPSSKQFCPRCEAPAPIRETPVAGDEDDGKPYVVNQNRNEKYCRKCHAVLAADADKCHACDHDMRVIARPTRYTSVDITYAFGWQVQTRMAALLAFQISNIVALSVSMILGMSTPVGFGGLVFTIFAQLFVVGSFRGTRFRRDAKGRVTVQEVWRIGFVPTIRSEVKWRQCHGIRLSRDAEPVLIDWFMMLTLLGAGVIPGVAWWWFVIRPDKLEIHFVGPHDTSECLVHRGVNLELADDVIRTASELTELQRTGG